MKIIADENIPFAEQLFSNLGSTTLLPGRAMQREDLKGADILLTRSVTKVNENLLAENEIQFVGTCTIGTDHIDRKYLQANNIGFASAPGCNALGVVQYDISALAQLDKLDASLRYAVVGCGNVGGRLYRHLKALGFDCIGVDPYLTQAEIPELEEFEAVFDCDVICVHTPLVLGGPHPTKSLIGAKELRRFKAGATIINAGRGECVDNDALLEVLKSGFDLNVVLDVWANEPSINAELFRYVKIGTPHIAGYSYEGRVNGSIMIFDALAKHLEKDPAWTERVLAKLRTEVFGPRQPINATSLAELVLKTYQIQNDHDGLAKALLSLPGSFDKLRKNYFKRREFAHYYFTDTDNSLQLSEQAEALGFGV